jgi:hypothetical protein
LNSALTQIELRVGVMLISGQRVQAHRLDFVLCGPPNAVLVAKPCRTPNEEMRKLTNNPPR